MTNLFDVVMVLSGLAMLLVCTVGLPAKTSSLSQVSALLDRYKTQIAVALPKHMTPERMIRVALTCISQTPLLLKCEAYSLCASVVQASILGLEPNSALGEAYLVPYWNTKANRYEAQLQIGYKGHCKLARNSGEIATIDAQGVRTNDDFDFEKGACPTLRHKWAKSGSRGDLLGYWAGYRTRAGEFNFEYWPLEDILAHRDHYSKAAFVTDKGKRVLRDGQPVLQGAWLESPDWMCKKTVLIQALKLAPKSVQMQTAIDLDERADLGMPQQFSPEIPVDLAPTQGAEVVDEPEPPAEPEVDRGEGKPPTPAGATTV
jgi:recombination protein RecT